MINKDPWSHLSRYPTPPPIKAHKITQFQDEVRLGLMDVTIVIDETVSRELTEHNTYGGQKGGFQSTTEKYTLPTTTLRNVHYACTWACPTSSACVGARLKNKHELRIFIFTIISGIINCSIGSQQLYSLFIYRHAYFPSSYMYNIKGIVQQYCSSIEAIQLV